LHWIRNDGAVRNGELLLLDAGVEMDSYYTADITRTLPVNGKFTPAQRTLYMLVYEAQLAGFAAVKPGVQFLEINRYRTSPTALESAPKNYTFWENLLWGIS
jgi:Xaa-Pro aminopeptidase